MSIPEYRVDPDNPAHVVYLDGAKNRDGARLWADPYSACYRSDGDVEGWTRLVPVRPCLLRPALEGACAARPDGAVPVSALRQIMGSQRCETGRRAPLGTEVSRG